MECLVQENLAVFYEYNIRSAKVIGFMIQDDFNDFDLLKSEGISSEKAYIEARKREPGRVGTCRP